MSFEKKNLKITNIISVVISCPGIRIWAVEWVHVAREQLGLYVAMSTEYANVGSM
jgi:hypothetical protein